MYGKDSAQGFGIGFLLGAVVGGITAILYAPHSGTLTRGLVDEKLHEATQKAEKIIEEAKDKAEDILFRLRQGESSRDFIHIRHLLDKYFESAVSPEGNKENAKNDIFFLFFPCFIIRAANGFLCFSD